MANITLAQALGTENAAAVRHEVDARVSLIDNYADMTLAMCRVMRLSRSEQPCLACQQGCVNPAAHAAAELALAFAADGEPVQINPVRAIELFFSGAPDSANER